ncbi:MAG TPA: hypothetical protein VN673_07115 [Clostridia bacterium]|nr:hypothetical protein [Clostridia bacterium]
MNVGGGPDSHTPQSWASMGALSLASRSLVKSKGGLGGLLDSLKAVNPAAGQFVERLAGMGMKLGLIAGTVGLVVKSFGLLRGAMREVWQLAEQSESLGVTSKFLLTVGKAAQAAGDDANEAIGKLQKFQLAIGAAVDGQKNAKEVFSKLGVNPVGMTMEDAVAATAEAFSKMKDPTEKASMAVELFGRGGQSLVQVLEKLGEAQKKARYGIVEQGDLDVLAESERRWMSFKAGIVNWFKDYSKVVAASWLRWSGLVKNVPESQSERIEESSVARAEARQKAEESIAKAREEYQKSLRESATDETKLAYSLAHAGNLMRQIDRISGETADKLKLQKNLQDEMNKIEQIRKGLSEKREQQLEKERQYQERLIDLERQKNQTINDGAKAMADRSGWSLEEILKQPLKYNRNGYAIIPQQLFEAAERFENRRLSQGEVNEMSRNYERQWKTARAAMDAGEGAKALSLLMPSRAIEATDMELKMRKRIEGLTSSERDPMGSSIERLNDIDCNIAELLRRAANEGLAIRPKMGQ